VFYVAAELSRRDARIESWLPEDSNADLRVKTRKGTMVVIRVKGKSSPEWQVPADLEKLDAFPGAERFIVFVDMDPRTAPAPAYWIAPERWVRTDITRHHRAYLARNKGRRPRSPEAKHHTITFERIREWRDRWELLDV
jgi:hypothetical protein